MAYEDVTVTAAELAEFFNMSPSQVRNMAEDGKLVRAPQRARYLLKASVRKYAEHLRLAASRRGDSTTAAGLTVERARLAKQQADLAALKAATLRGEMVPAADVEARMEERLGCLALSALGRSLACADPATSPLKDRDCGRRIRDKGGSF